MIALYQPIAGVESEFDGWQPALLDGDETALGALATAGPLFGARAFHTPAAPDQADDVGALIPTFSGDFYDRLHISDASIDLGNVIGLQERTVNIWNAYRRNQPLAALTAAGGEGLTLAGQPAPPIDFAVLQERTYTLSVSTSGPPTVDATYTWDFAPYDLVMHVTGSRVTAWTFPPDWTNPVIERLEWLTDILQAYDGTEQARALRLAPRKVYEFDAFFIGTVRRYAESLLWGWGARVWALPIWPDGLDLPAAANADATEIVLDTATRDYSDGSLAMIIGTEFLFEVVEVAEVLADRLVLARPLSASWPAGTRIYPARMARLQDQVRLPRWDGDASGARIMFDLVEAVDHTASAGATTFRGFPVITHRPEWSGGLDIELQRKLASLDNLTGLRVYEDESGMPSASQVLRWTWVSRAEQETYRRLLYALRGRHGRAWVPTWAHDLQVVALIGDSATNIDVEFCAYTKQIDLAPNRRDIRIELTDGTIYYRRITGSEDISGGVERLGIDSALGRTVQVAEVAMVSYLALSRLEGDTVELSHWTGDVCDSVTTFRSFRHVI